jgi:hypothetical protein
MVVAEAVQVKRDKMQLLLVEEEAVMVLQTLYLDQVLIMQAAEAVQAQEHLDLAKEELVVLAEVQTEQKTMDKVMGLMQQMEQVEVAVDLEMVQTALATAEADQVL